MTAAVIVIPELLCPGAVPSGREPLTTGRCSGIQADAANREPAAQQEPWKQITTLESSRLAIVP